MGLLFGFLPILASFLAWLLIWSPTSGSPVRRGLRLSAVTAWLLTTFGMVLVTEVLSQLVALKTAWPVRLVWLGATAGVASAVVVRRRDPRELVLALVRVFERDRFVSVLLGVGIFAALACALFTPPNSYDGLTYHVARTESWLLQGSVVHFATSDLRQIEFGPLNAFWFLHLALLTGHDLFFNGVQLVALVFVLLPSASFLCEKLGASASVRGFVLVSIAATPMVILQSSSTQNDLLVASLLLASVSFAWLALEAPDPWLGALLGIAVGLCVFTKGTALVFGLAYAAWFGFHALRRFSRRLATSLLPTAALGLAINLGHYGRNYRSLGSVFGEASSWNRPAELTVAGVLSTLAKNLSLNVATPIYRLNERIEQAFRSLHDRLLPVSVDDAGLNFFGERFVIANAWNDEEHAANLLQLAIVLGCGLLALLHKLRPTAQGLAPHSELARGFGTAALLQLVLFSTLLNWQTWGNRLLTAWFCGSLVACAPVLTALAGRASFLRIATFGVFVAGLPWLLGSEMRPLIGPRSILFRPRESQWFAAWPEQGQTYSALLGELEQRPFKTLGFHVRGEKLTAPVLPVQRFAKQRGGPAPFVHVGVTNASRKLRDPSVEPDVVVSDYHPFGETLEVDARCYARAWTQDTLGLYVPKPCAAQAPR